MRDIVAFGGIKAVDEVTVDLHGGRCGPSRPQRCRQIDADQSAVGRLSATPGYLIDGTWPDPPARDAGFHNIETIYQTLALADNLDAAATCSWDVSSRQAPACWTMSDGGGDPEDPGPAQPELPEVLAPVSALSGGQRQSVAIARAVYFDAGS